MMIFLKVECFWGFYGFFVFVVFLSFVFRFYIWWDIVDDRREEYVWG